MSKIVKTTEPHYKVLGLKSLKNVSFSSEAEAIRQLHIHELMEYLWSLNIDFSVPNPSYEIAEAIIEYALKSKQKTSPLKKITKA